MQINPKGQSLPRKLLGLIIHGLYLLPDNRKKVSSIECISTQVYTLYTYKNFLRGGEGGGGEERERGEGASGTPSHFSHFM